jgi:hypothetical protein
VSKHQRKIEDERDARECLAAVRAAGGDIGAWARSHGVDGRSLNAWRVNLARGLAGSRGRRKKRASRTQAQVAPISAKLVEIVAAPSAPSPARYALQIGTTAVEFGDDFREETLRRVVAMLRSC